MGMVRDLTPWKTFTDNAGTGTTALLAATAVPAGVEGLLAEVAIAAMVNNTATSFRYGFDLYDASGNPIFDGSVAGLTASDIIGASFTVFGAGGCEIQFGADLPDETRGGTAQPWGFTSRAIAVPSQVGFRRIVLGGALTSLNAVVKIYRLWPSAAGPQ